MDNVFDFLNRSYYDNSLWNVLAFVLLLFLGTVFKRLLTRLSSNVMFKVFKNYTGDFSRKDFHAFVKKTVGNLLLLIFVYLAFNQLSLPSILNFSPKEEFGLRMVLERAYFALLILAFVSVFRKMIDFMGLVMLKKAETKEKKVEIQLIPFAVESLKLIVLILGIVVVLGSVFKINVGTLIAGLGIGGLAVALAAKETFENLIGSFTIFLDKPFVTGDMVKVGNTQGVVEKVGFRSTRLRTLDKTFVTVPNRDMVNSEVDNFTERTIRRVNFNIGLRYDTEIEAMKLIIAEIKSYIDNHTNTTEDCTVKFAEFGSSSLNIMVLYFIDGNDFKLFVDVREEINVRIMEIVKAHGCDFAFPSTSVYMEK